MTDDELRNSLSAWQVPRSDASKFRTEVWQRIGQTEPGIGSTTIFSQICRQRANPFISLGFAIVTLVFSSILAFNFSKEIQCTLDSEKDSVSSPKKPEGKILNGKITSHIKFPVNPSD